MLCKHRGHVATYETRHPQVYKMTMKNRSHSVTTTEDWALALAGESNEVPAEELTTVPATSGN